MDTYFRFKMTAEFIIPISLVLFLITIGMVNLTISTIKSNRIEKFFINSGYERELFDVSSCGMGDYYGWVRKSDGKRVDDRDIRGWSLKQIKDKFR